MVNVPGILAPGMAEGEQVNLLPYFSGALASTNRNNMPTSVNFIDGGGADAIIANPTSAGADGSNQQKLFTHLYQYFGKLLGCSQYGMMGFPAYSGAPSQYNVHKYMNLDHAQMTYFIQQVGLAAKSFGVSDADIMTAATSLNNAFNYRCSPPTEIIPEQGKQLQSMCTNETCPLDPKSTCAAYPNNAMASNPAPASSMMAMPSAMGGSAVTQKTDGQPQAMTSAAVSQISDNQPQAATSAPAVTQISDNQPQAATSAVPVSQISDNQPQAATSAATPMMTPTASPAMYTGAAAANAIPAIAGGFAGLAAFFL